MATQTLYTTQQFKALNPTDQARYLQSLTPQQAAQYQQVMSQQKLENNAKFMHNSVRRYAPCASANGAGLTQPYAFGSTLTWDMPVEGSGYAKRLIITCALTVNCAAGTGANSAANPAAPWNLFSELDVLYNGQQIRTHPYIAALVDGVFGGYNQAMPGQVVGTSVAAIRTKLFSGIAVATGNNTWNFVFSVPLNPISDDSPFGLLPIFGVGTQPQVKLVCASAALGPDPLLNAVASTGGTGNAVTVTGNVNVDVEYLDGTNYQTTTPLTLDLSGQPTIQWAWDQVLNPLSANLVTGQRIVTLKRHAYVISLVIDGVQSSSFSTVGNITGLKLSPDFAGQQSFFKFGLDSNISVFDWWDAQERIYGQDLPQGVIPWVIGPDQASQDASNHYGTQVLNMEAGGYPATSHFYQVTSVGGVANVTPRVETFVIYYNYDGLLTSSN